MVKTMNRKEFFGYLAALPVGFIGATQLDNLPKDNKQELSVDIDMWAVISELEGRMYWLENELNNTRTLVMNQHTFEGKDN